MDKEHVFHTIRETLAVIPYGKVATVQEMALGLEIGEDEILWAAKEISDNMIPVHRLVRDDGTLLGEIQLFNEDAQRELLEKEGITFSDADTVNLEHHFWSTCDYVKISNQ